jgi:hypothetical protein
MYAAQGPQWGNVAEWIAAIGTVGALWYALVQFGQHRRARHIEQARLVSAWIRSIREPDVPLSSDQTEITLVLRNGSPEPIYNCAVYVWTSDPPELGVDLPAVGGVSDLVPPSTESESTAFVDIPFYSFEEAHGRGLSNVDLLFTDASGSHWHRDRGGRLISRSEGYAD